MRIGIIGAGYIGRAVAGAAVKAGHEVMVSNSRSPGTLFSLTGIIGCKAGTVAEAAAFGEMVLVAIPLHAYTSIPIAPLAGKIVLDASNYYPQRDGHIAELDEEVVTVSGLLARHLPTSRVVKAFNAIAAGDIEKNGLPTGSPERRALPIAGDDPEAKRVVTAFFDQIGYDVVDAGPLTEEWRFQKDTPAYCVPFNRERMQAALAAA
ncbi:MAG: NAD(P)-binding domain-containing protein [Polaromonas sp.]|nr:NAD(P)-binding domain-containing protein [Polaromonas sp.]